jgi:hypothetical protein
VSTGMGALLLIGLAFAFLSDRFALAQRLPDWLKITASGACLYLAWLLGERLKPNPERGGRQTRQ